MPDKPVKDPLTVGEAFDVMLDSSDSVRRSADYLRHVVTNIIRPALKVMVPTVIALALVATALIFQIELRNDKIEKLERTQVELKTQLEETSQASKEAKDAANKAAIAAESADSSLKAAIAQSQQSSQSSNEAVNKIDEIYACIKQKQC
jgi:diacylglycerol kinase